MYIYIHIYVNLEKCLKLEVYICNLIEEWEEGEKSFLGEDNFFFFRKQKGDKVYDKVSFSTSIPKIQSSNTFNCYYSCLYIYLHMCEYI